MSSGFPQSPQVLRGGIVLVDPDSGAVLRVISLQYNPDSLTRTLQPQDIGEGADRSEVLRIKGPPVETIKLEAEIDATDQLEQPDQNPDAVRFGIFPQISALETIVYPPSAQLLANDVLAQAGTLEIAPMEGPLVLFVFSASRVIPVRITELSVTEEAFDTGLNPTRAKVSLGMRVLSVNDLGFSHKGGSLFMIYQQQKETFARKNKGGSLGGLGISRIP